MATVNLVGAVWVRKDYATDPECFGPGEVDVPQWALDKMGDHCFEAGSRGSSGADGDYDSLKKADLEAEVARRNAERADDEQIVVGGNGTKADLVQALHADDEAQA